MNQLPDKKKDSLNKLIGKNMLQQPSDQFTASVMQKLGIATAPVIKYEPVIPRTGWIFIFIASALIIWLALSGSSELSLGAKTIVVQSAIQQSTSFFEQLFSGSVALMLAIGTFAVFLLFGAESWYRQAQLRTS